MEKIDDRESPTPSNWFDVESPIPPTLYTLKPNIIFFF